MQDIATPMQELPLHMHLDRNLYNNNMNGTWSLLHWQLAIVTMTTMVANAECSKNS
jgi:hypothetical protein